ncbi:MAG TPA: transglutaminase family protein [Pelomicrobium sp.]|nr:transglutaminase family protein [Pelomicrobium sp.]
MSIHVALNHQTHYRFDRPVKLSPHEIRLRPAPHCRTPVLSYSLKIEPAKHFINWQQDAFGNWIARIVFPEPSRHLDVVVDLVADMTVINPFDFFVEDFAEFYPFAYPPQLKRDLAPFLEVEPATPQLAAWIERYQRERIRPDLRIIDLLVDVNRALQQDVGYVIRMEPGVQAPEQTLSLKLGSCRDTGWLLTHILRHMGLAARFVSGYLVQLTADMKALDGPSGPEQDFTDLHAWTEAYVPGAGWIGLDPTSGLLAGEGHIPVAATPVPGTAAPVSGFTDPCQARMEFAMSVTRISEDPRVTKPFTEEQWSRVDALGRQVDAELEAGDVRLTMGGEPTFVSIDDMDGPEWNVTALSDRKRELAEQLLRRLADRYGHRPLLHFGQGKWYPGEPLPRWALACFFRADGEPLLRHPEVLDGRPGPARDPADAKRFIDALAKRLGLAARHAIPAYEDVPLNLLQEQRLPKNVDPLRADLKEPGERARLARLLARGLKDPGGYVLPLKPAPRVDAGAGRGTTDITWMTSPWPLRRERLYLVSGDSPVGYRLPLSSLPWVAPDDAEPEFDRDPFEARAALGRTRRRRGKAVGKDAAPREIIHTALCTEVRAGRLYVFMPPVPTLEDYLDLVAAIEDTAVELDLPATLEGYTPPNDPRLREIKVTPDPGVIEVNVHPAHSWAELTANTEALYEDARQTRLGTEKFMLDGRHTGTGGGNHVTIGGATAADSPILRRPDVLKSLITYWQNHPALSYLFSGQFIGPTSQAPRVDEARHDSLYELEIAFQQLESQAPPGRENDKPWLVDRLLRNLLVDLTGNTHRAEFCIDKLYSPQGPAGRLGLVELRAFEMPPHWRMSCLQMLLFRALIARFWREPYDGKLIRWGTELHDRFLLPHFVIRDLEDVIRDLRRDGYAFDYEWFAPFVEFRFPRHGSADYHGVGIELRQAIEPWNVLGEEMQAGATARYVDSSVERLQVKVTHMTDSRHVVTCNGRPLPLTATGVPGEFVAGVRFRAWNPPSALHPTIGVHAPLTFDLVDMWSGRSLGGCTYHVAHPGGRNFTTFPVNANEAEARRIARFWNHGHTPGPMAVRPEGRNPAFPMTLDLRREAEPMLLSITAPSAPIPPPPPESPSA